MTNQRVIAWFSRQRGLITRQQALAAGMTADQIRTMLESGHWVAHRRGVYALAGVPPSREQAVLGAVLAAGSETVASHLTAAALWDLGFPIPAGIDVLTPPDRRFRLEGVRQHRTTSLHESDRSLRHGVPVTSPARTIVDCSGTVGEHRLEEIVDEAERRKLVRIVGLTACVDRIATGPGRRPTIAIRDVLSERLPGGDSVAEKKLVRDLVRRGVPMPVLGLVIVVKGRKYKLDAAWPWARLSLEYESWEFHRQFTAFHRGHDRARRIRAASWDLWPVTSRTDLDELADDLLAALSGALKGSAPHKSPESA